MNIFRIILSVLILFIPLYPKFPLANFNGTYVALRLDDIVVATCALIWVLWQIKNKFPILKQRVSFLFLAYITSIFISTLIAILIYRTTPASILFLHFFRRLEYISLFFIALNSLKTKKDFSPAYIFLLICLLGVAIYGYGQRYLNFPIVSTMNEEFSRGQLLHMDVWTRISSTFAGHYDLAAFLSLILIILISVISLTKNKFLRVISIIIFLISFDILTRTASRVSIFAFWGGSIISLFLIKKYFWIVPISALIIYSIFTSGDLNQRLIATINSLKPKNTTTNVIKPTIIPTPTPIVVIATTLSPFPIKKMSPTPIIIRHGPVDEIIPVDADVGVARSGEIRFNVEWPRAISAFSKNIIFGTGLGSISLATDNDYLRSLGESGLLGLFTFLFIPIYFIFKTLKLFWIKKTDIYIQLQLAFVGVIFCALANAIFIDIFEASKIAYTFWILMAVFYRLIELNNSHNEHL